MPPSNTPDLPPPPRDVVHHRPVLRPHRPPLVPGIPDPTRPPRSAARASPTRAASSAHSRARSNPSAATRFCNCDRDVSHRTCIPVGRCVSSTVDSVLLRFCPPGPVP